MRGGEGGRESLPVWGARTALLHAVEENAVTVVVGETGSGKSTQIPQFLCEAGWTEGGRCVVCTQPRRIAACALARRVAAEVGCAVGEEVGYAVRFDDCTSYKTRIRYTTDGLLVREMMRDPLLSRFSVVVVDEAHERSLATDVLLGLLKKVLRRRTEDFRVVVSSATIDAERVREFFGQGCTLSVAGRTFPVELLYTPQPVADYVRAAVDVVIEIHEKEPSGDILVFLTGQEEVSTAIAMIEQTSSAASISAMPLYGALPYREQLSVFEPARRGTRKVVVATNVAETSVTIEGIVFVVDCGFVKHKFFCGASAVDSLIVTPVSQASANQRAGRAGRTSPGRCFRLFTEEDFKKLQPFSVPDIQRTALASLVLQLKSLGIDDLLHFDFMDPPPRENLARALELMFCLGAIDERGSLTDPMGVMLSEFPGEPQLGRMLLASGDLGCSEEVLAICAMLSVQNVWSGDPNATAGEGGSRPWAVAEGDHLSMLNLFRAFRQHQGERSEEAWCKKNRVSYRALLKAMQVRDQLLRFLKGRRVPIASCGLDPKPVTRSIVCGFFANAAVLQDDGSYRPIRGGKPAWIHPGSVLSAQPRPPRWLVFHEIVVTTKPFMRDVTAIDSELLLQVAPQYFVAAEPLPQRERKKI